MGEKFVKYDGIMFVNSDEYWKGFLYMCACYGAKFRVVETKNISANWVSITNYIILIIFQSYQLCGFDCLFKHSFIISMQKYLHEAFGSLLLRR